MATAQNCEKWQKSYLGYHMETYDPFIWRKKKFSKSKIFFSDFENFRFSLPTPVTPSVSSRIFFFDPFSKTPYPNGIWGEILVGTFFVIGNKKIRENFWGHPICHCSKNYVGNQKKLFFPKVAFFQTILVIFWFGEKISKIEIFLLLGHFYPLS